uniref:hypothetical protein n=1 Tax=Enterococcus faecalis TaxID=1351 RepID=UPI0034CFCA5A
MKKKHCNNKEKLRKICIALGITLISNTVINQGQYYDNNVYAEENTSYSNQYAASGEYPASPKVLPVQNYVKNTAESGLLVGDEVSSTYTKRTGSGTIYQKYADTNGASGQALRVALYPADGVGDGGLEITGPLYSNTNYTMEIVGRNHGDVGPMRIGYKGSVSGGEKWTRLEGSTYKKQTMSFTTLDRNHDYQVTPSERVTAYIYRLFSADGNKPMDARILSIKMIPNDPILQSSEQTIQFKLSEVRGMTRNQILETYRDRINQQLAGVMVDSNNNNNPVPVTVNQLSEENNTVISAGGQNFDTTFVGEKWGKERTDNLHITIISD